MVFKIKVSPEPVSLQRGCQISNVIFLALSLNVYCNKNKYRSALILELTATALSHLKLIVMGRTKLIILIQNTIANEWKTVQILQCYQDIKLSIKCCYYNGHFVGHFTLKYLIQYDIFVNCNWVNTRWQ